MQTVPVFKDATPREIRTMRFWIGANIAVILFCAFWLAYYFTLAASSWPYLMAALLAGYFLGDFSSGAVHWAMDTWFDERTMGRAIAITREHHTHPDHVYGFLENASFGSAPSAVAFGIAAVVTALCPVSAVTWTLMLLWLISAICLLIRHAFSQSRAQAGPLGDHAAGAAASSGVPAGASLGSSPQSVASLLRGERMGELCVRRAPCLARPGACDRARHRNRAACR
jgi:hypothetical protein